MPATHFSITYLSPGLREDLTGGVRIARLSSQEWGKLTSNPYTSGFQSGVPWEPPRASDKSGYLAQQRALHGTRADFLRDIHKDSCGSKRGDLSVYITGKPSGK